jgi:hypothetical protein
MGKGATEQLIQWERSTMGNLVEQAIEAVTIRSRTRRGFSPSRGARPARLQPIRASEAFAST